MAGFAIAKSRPKDRVTRSFFAAAGAKRLRPVDEG
jgi:hypothetical protein